MTTILSEEQKIRYHRHLLLDGFGEQGQIMLLNSKVLIIGAGGLGSPIALYLAAAGVGTIGIADGDKVSLSNLQRQIIHNSNDIERLKIDSATEKLTCINPEINIKTYPVFITKENILELIQSYDFIIEATDSYTTKYLVNDACILTQKAFCVGGINRYNGQLMTHIPGSACYRCLYPEPPRIEELEQPTQLGVLGSIVGVIGTLQATEAIKYITNIGTLLVNQILLFNALTMNFQKIEISKDKECIMCGDNPTIHSL